MISRPRARTRAADGRWWWWRPRRALPRLGAAPAGGYGDDHALLGVDPLAGL